MNSAILLVSGFVGGNLLMVVIITLIKKFKK